MPFLLGAHDHPQRCMPAITISYKVRHCSNMSHVHHALLVGRAGCSASCPSLAYQGVARHIHSPASPLCAILGSTGCSSAAWACATLMLADSIYSKIQVSAFGCLWMIQSQFKSRNAHRQRRSTGKAAPLSALLNL